MIDAAIQGKISLSDCITEPFFNLKIPKIVPGVPPNTLIPRELWTDKRAYDQAAKILIEKFDQNFKSKNW
jgi:phosphoenolpyruvate carboxykinase (ATP)